MSTVPGSQPEVAELERVRQKLQSHLEASAHYDVSLLLSRLSSTQLWQEQVIVHAKASTPRLGAYFHRASVSVVHITCISQFHYKLLAPSAPVT